MACRTGTKSGPTTSTLASASFDDVLDLGRGQPPVDVDAHRVEQRRAEEHLEVLDAVLVEERDAILAADAGSGQQVGHPARPLVQLRPSSSTALAQDERRTGRRARPRARE